MAVQMLFLPERRINMALYKGRGDETSPPSLYGKGTGGPINGARDAGQGRTSHGNTCAEQWVEWTEKADCFLACEDDDPFEAA